MMNMSVVRRPGDRLRPGRRGAAAALALLLAASVAVAGCGSGSAGSSAAASSGGDKAAAPNRAEGGAGQATDSGATGSGAAPGRAPATGGTIPAPATYLVRTADLTVRTPHVEDALAKARDLAAAAGGYAGDEDTSVDSGGHARSSVQLRVPPAAYDKLLDDLAGLGTLLDRKVSVQDVTGQVVDVGSRIRSQQASVARVRALMDRAGQLSDVVSLEGELSTREAALESLEAQQASLKSRTNLATVTLRLTEPPVRPAEPRPKKHDGFGTSVGNALGDGWHAFYVTTRGVLVAVSVMLPFLLAALVVWIAYLLVRRRLPHRAPSARDSYVSLPAPDAAHRGVPAPTAPGESGRSGGPREHGPDGQPPVG